jgi:prepilin-type N-terminal cleavage/methylation domain-containing protein
MQKQNGFTLIEAFIVVAIVGILAAIVGGAVLNNPGETESRATENAKRWASNQGVQTRRLSCAHDSDMDGYGSCTIVTNDGERINLQCASGFYQQATGSSGCKEIDGQFKMNQTIRGAY